MKPIYLDETKTDEEGVNDLVARMTRHSPGMVSRADGRKSSSESVVWKRVHHPEDFRLLSTGQRKSFPNLPITA